MFWKENILKKELYENAVTLRWLTIILLNETQYGVKTD